MEVTGKMLDYTAHMSSIQAKYFNREGRGGKKRHQDAMRRPGGGELRACAPTDIGQKCRLFYLSPWITSSARRRSDGGIVIPSALAVLRLRTSLNFMACSTGTLAGLAPFRILSTW